MRTLATGFERGGSQRRIALIALLFLAHPLVSYVATAQEQRVIERFALQELEPFTISVSRLTNQSYVTNQSFDGSQRLAVVNNANGALSFLALGERRLKGGIDVDQRTGRVYITLTDGPSPGPAVGFVDASGTGLTAFELFDFRPEGGPFPEAQRLIATNEITGHVFLLGDDGSGAAIGIFDPSIQEPSIPQVQGLIVIPFHDLIAPRGIAVNSQTNQVYVLGETAQAEVLLGVVDADTQSLTQVTFNGEFFTPFSIGLNEATNRIYLGGGGATGMALAEVNGIDNSFELIPIGSLTPVDIGVSDAANQVFVVGNNELGEGEVQIFDATTRMTNTIALGPFAPNSVSVNQATGIAYIAGVDFGPEFGSFVLALGLPVCDAEPTTLDAIQTEVLALPTSQETIEELLSSLRAASRSHERGDNESARLAITRFIRRLVKASNKEPSDPDSLELMRANDLVCSASNVLVGIDLP